MKNRLIIFNLKNWAVFAFAIAAASFISILLSRFSTSDFHVPMIFVLAVLVISLYTEGYFYGVLAAVVGVFAVNWAFTYPYFAFNFSLPGYLLTFVTMLTVGIVTSLLSSRSKEQERARMESEREKIRANLLRAISHDLRTPLTSISGSISTVLEEGALLSESRKAELLADAKSDAEWLCRMVDNLLSVTRIRSDSNVIRKENELLEEVVAEAALTFAKRNPHINLDIQLPANPVFVPMDAMLVEQVLINIMDNAVIHGVTTDKIKIIAVEDSKFVNVCITDNGKGISKAIIDHLFDGSLQLTYGNAADNNKFMGIGLQVCKTIVEAHGGRITARNTDEGAEFSFSLAK